MLSKLDDIAWGQLTHAYGRADDVPALLRQLASEAKEECSTAINALYGNLWHQGTVYEATAHAVPFLIELAMSPDVVCRPAILCYLQALATGSSYLDGNAPLGRPATTESAEFRERVATERGWVKTAHDAVLLGFDGFAQLLACDDVEVRRDVPVVLSACTERGSDVVELLDVQLRHERDEQARASAAYVLSEYASKYPSALGSLEARFNDANESHLVRVTASLGLLGAGDGRERILDFLAAAVPGIDKPLNQLSAIHMLGRGDGVIPEVSSWLMRVPEAQSRWLERVLRHDHPEVREAALWEVNEACMHSRLVTRELIPPVAERLKESVEHVRNRAIAVLGTLGKDAPSAAAAVLSARSRVVKQIRQQVQRHRAEHLMEHWVQRERKDAVKGRTDALLQRVDELFDSLRHTARSELAEIVLTLGNRRRQRSMIEPAIVRLSMHDNQWVRIHAARALWNLTSDPDLVLPALQRELICRPAGLLALDCIGQMGAAAAPLVPQLRRMIEQDQRLPVVGAADSWIAKDECFVEAAVDVLAQVENAARA